VKRSGRDEPMWVVTHMCIEATLRISLHSYLYCKLAKTPCFYYLLYFFLLQNWRTRGLNRFCLEVGGGGEGREDVAQIMYIHVSKCKNDKIIKILKI
jgi:hypothetical protein